MNSNEGDNTEEQRLQVGPVRLDGFVHKAIDTMEDIFVVFDLTGRFLIWNESARQVTGYTDEEILEKKPVDFFKGEDRGNVQGTIARGLVNGFAKVEAGLTSKDGKVTRYEFYGTPVYNDAGEPVAVTAIGRDITERLELMEKQKEVAAARANAEAAQRYAEELRDLITVAAHELRHPATIMKGYANILMKNRDNLDSRNVKDILSEVDAAADRLAHIVTELFETSLIERSKLELSLEDSLPSSLVRGCFDRVHSAGCHCAYNLVSPGQEQKPLKVDAARITEVLAIIVENAVKYSPEDGEIDIWFEQDSGITTFYVADRGPGIPEAHRQRIFDRFYQVEDARHHSLPGVGLGLHIAKCVVEAHGGRIRMEPRDGGGSVFWFTLPDRNPGDFPATADS